jgi:hypothetical protein
MDTVADIGTMSASGFDLNQAEASDSSVTAHDVDR